MLNTYPCVRNRVYEACPQSITSAGLWPLERNGTSYAKAGPVGDEDLKGPYSARGRLERLALTSPQGVLSDSWGHTAQQQWPSKLLNEVIGAIDNKSNLYSYVEQSWAQPEDDCLGGEGGELYHSDPPDRELHPRISPEVDLLRKMVEELQSQLAVQQNFPSPVLATPPTYSGGNEGNRHTESPRAYSSVAKDPWHKGPSESDNPIKEEIHSPDLFGVPTPLREHDEGRRAVGRGRAPLSFFLSREPCRTANRREARAQSQGTLTVTVPLVFPPSASAERKKRKKKPRSGRHGVAGDHGGDEVDERSRLGAILCNLFF